MKCVGKIVKKEVCNKTYREISEFFKKILADVVVHIQTLLACVLSHSTVSDSVTPMDCSPPGSSVHGILQARRVEWGAMPSSRGSSQPRNQIHVSCVSCIAGGFLTC
ncbi:unnamed protein product [Rangifer tarandus platyrhynchus]|uniref:Uncharacterized protein n=1 Tax=Rangifer tarandus platyrhynchus TaxID=3082113 RepID=A0AC60A5Y6_RANTA